MDPVDDGQAPWTDNKFYAVPKNILSLSKLLKCMSFSEKVNIYINDSGIRMTVEEAKVLQVCVFLEKDLFQVYRLKDDEELAMKISLKEMLECLKKISPESSKNFTSRTIDPLPDAKMFFTVDNDESIFKMLLIEDNTHTFFQMRAEPYDELIEFEIEPQTVKILMRSQELWEYFKLLEDVSPELIDFKVSTQDSLILNATCTEGSVELIIPSSADVVESYECVQELKSTYKLSNLKHAIKIMLLSTKCTLKMDPRGILSFAFLVEADVDSLVEYYCLPQVQDLDANNVF